MRDLSFQNAGCEPARGPRALLVLIRRALRRVLRPIFARQVEILTSIVERLDAVDARLDSQETNLERQVAIMRARAQGISSHLNGLTADHYAVAHRLNAVEEQSQSSAGLIRTLGVRQDDLEDKMQAVHALHWDHVALARRLGALEDLLARQGEAGTAATDPGEPRPLVPFPGLEGPRKSRVS
jgi:hypothetical protein